MCVAWPFWCLIQGHQPDLFVVVVVLGEKGIRRKVDRKATKLTNKDIVKWV